MAESFWNRGGTVSAERKKFVCKCNVSGNFRDGSLSGEEQEVLTFDELQMLAVYRQLSVGEKDLIHDVVKLLQGYEVKRK